MLVEGRGGLFEPLEKRLSELGRTGYQLRARIVGTATVTHTLLTPADATTGVSVAQSHLRVTCAGVIGDKHFGEACVGKHDDVLRFVAGVEKGTPCAHIRSVTMVSQVDLQTIAQIMGLPDPAAPPGLLGENLILDTPCDRSILGTRAVVLSPEGVSRKLVFTINGLNYPCGTPEAALMAHYETRFETHFKDVAVGRRGVLASVMLPGPAPFEDGCVDDPVVSIYPGDRVVFFL